MIRSISTTDTHKRPASARRAPVTLWTILAVLLLSTFLLAGCGTTQAPPPEGPAAGGAAGDEKTAGGAAPAADQTVAAPRASATTPPVTDLSGEVMMTVTVALLQNCVTAPPVWASITMAPQPTATRAKVPNSSAEARCSAELIASPMLSPHRETGTGFGSGSARAKVRSALRGCEVLPEQRHELPHQCAPSPLGALRHEGPGDPCCPGRVARDRRGQLTCATSSRAGSQLRRAPLAGPNRPRGGCP